MKNQLKTLKSESEALTAQALELQKQHNTLLPAAQAIVPDVDAIRQRLTDALGSGDETARRTINNELTAAKLIAQTVLEAQNELAAIVQSRR